MSDEWGLIAGHYGLISGVAALIVLICLAYGTVLRRRRLRLIGSPPPRWRVLLQDSLVGFAALLCCLTPLRPYWGKEELRTELLSQEIVIVLDVSASMAADDLKPSRLAHARRTLDSLLTKLNAATAAKVGIVLFAGTSYVYCPVTPDLTAVKLFLDNVSFELISTPGSALSEAIDTAVGAFSKETNVPRTIVVVTDGEEGQFAVEKAAQQLQSRATHVVLYGVGTTRGAPIQDEHGRFLKDRSGKIVISELQESNLKDLAARVNGDYILAHRVATDATALMQVLPQSVASSENSQTSVNTHYYREIGPVFALLALLLLITASFLSPEPLVAVFIGLLVMSTAPAAAQVEKLPEGYTAYQSGDFVEARTIFDKAHKEKPEDPTILRALASAHYKLKEYAVAEELFAKARDAADSSAESFMSSYNQGNAAFEKQDYKAARSAYQAALRIEPENQAAQHNLRLTEKRLEEQKQQRSDKSSQQEQNSESSSGEGDKENSQQQQQSSSKDNQSQNQEANQKNQDESSKRDPEASQQDQSAQEQNQEKDDKQGSQDRQSADSKSSETQSQEQFRENAQESGENEASSPQERATAQQKLSDEAAEAWLRSLPDQAILRKKRDRASVPRGGQTW